MTDSLLLPFTLDRVVDTAGAPMNGAKAYVYAAGTSTPLSVFSDSGLTTPAANPVVSDSGGWFPQRYIGVHVAGWKYVLKDSSDVTIKTEDALPAALDTSGFDATFAQPQTPVSNVAANRTLVEADLGKVFNCDPTGGAFVITLLSAAVAGDGARITLRHTGTANQVTIAAIGGQTIDGATSRALTGQYEGLCLVSDGANWHIDGYAPPIPVRGGLPFFKVTDRLTAPPLSPVAGARYILNGTGTGLWSGYSQHDVLESDGQGGWIRYTPAQGWFAFVEDEGLFTAFKSGAWADQTGMPTPNSSVLGSASFSHQLASGTAGGTATATAWTARTLNTTDGTITIPGCSRASNTITLPANRTFAVWFEEFHQSTTTVRSRFKSTTTSKAVESSNVTASSSPLFTVGFGIITLTDSEAFNLEYYRSGTSSTSDLGAANSNGSPEVYARVVIVDLTSLQGPQGTQGAQGDPGFAGFAFAFSTSTTMADPGAGILRLNNGTLSSVTAAAIDATSAASGNPDVSDEIAAWDDGGILKIVKRSAEQNWVTFDVTNVADSGGHLELTLVYRDHAGSFSNADPIAVQFSPAGPAGASGATAPVLDFEFNTATAGDPGSGKLLFNNATLASATTCSFSDLDRLNTDVSAIVATFDDPGASANRGTLYLVNVVTGAVVGAFKVTGSITDNGSFQTFSVTPIQGTAPANNTRVAAQFVPAGATGNINGSTGGTDNAYLRADGTGGATLQAARATEDDSGKQTVNFEDSGTNTVPPVLRLSRTTSGTAANGIGLRQEFAVENANGTTVVVGAIDLISTDVTNGSEDFDVSVKAIVGGALTEVARFLSTGVMYLANAAAKIVLHAAGGQNLTGGFTTTEFDNGTKSSGTLTPDPANGNMQKVTNGGAFTLAPPSATGSYSLVLDITNNGSAGAITDSGFTKRTGDAFDTTNAHAWRCFITKGQAGSHLHRQAMF